MRARFGKRITVAIGLAAMLLVGIAVAAQSAEPETVTPTVQPASAPRSATPGPLATPSAQTSTASPGQFDVAVLGNWQSLLAGLPSAIEQGAGYDRELFDHWRDADGDGCNARREVLIAESLTPVSVGASCSLSGGSWLSVYDGVRESDPAELDIDHFVPLKEAWDSGAWAWDARTRAAFANDLDYAASLIAVTASSNRAKGDKDPADWLPPSTASHCVYVATWLQVKARWQLSVDERERMAIARVLGGCDSASLAAVAVAPIALVALGAAPVAPPPASGGSAGSVPRFDTCSAAIAAGYGDFVAGTPEYEWYIDRDGDGVACER